MKVMKEAKFGIWVYYINDEGKARWKCSECGHLSKHDPYEKLYCSRCGSRNQKGA